MILREKCIIWGSPANTQHDGDRINVFSPRAGGEYAISRRAQSAIHTLDEPLKARLTSWLCEQRREGVVCPMITGDTLPEIQERRTLSIAKRVAEILRFIHAKTRLLGTEVVFCVPYGGVQELDLESPVGQAIDNFYNMLVCSECASGEELMFLLSYLGEQGLIENRGKHNKRKGCVLTIEGLTRISEMEMPQANSAQAFVAMWFDGSMNDAWSHGIKPAIQAAGYDPMRIDRKEHANKIDDEIIAEIKRSRFVVADFTHGDEVRGGVYYEAGYAYGLHTPVIFCCRSDCLDRLHFDTRQYNHIVWDQPEELCQKLSTRISALIGDGPHKPQ